MTTLHLEPLLIPGARLGDENPLPHFRATATERSVTCHASLPAEKRHLLGWETGFRVLPYRMQDTYSRQRAPLTFEAAILENEILKATFLPQLGGRLVSLFHKPENRELLCRNPVFQPANLAIRNAWFSGGIEWNIGQFGHTFTTCAPLFAAAITGAEGEPGLRMYEFERCKRLFWQMDFYLPPGSPWLIAHTRVYNPNPVDTSMYWWTNIAVPEGREVRVLAPANQAIATSFLAEGLGMALAELPNLPTTPGLDSTYSLNSNSATEFFFQPDETDLPWETALDENGSGLIEVSTPRLRYRKLFCWGSHQGGRHWQDFLAPGGQPYIEIQAGLAPTQLHGLVMPARADWHWTQLFGLMQADAQRVHAREWETAWRSVDESLKSRLSAEEMLRLDEMCGARSNLPAAKMLQSASGWGALELERSGESLPPSFVFPASTLGAEQQKWLALLQNGTLPEQSPAELPGEWLVQPEWRDLLEASPNRNWYALLHLGVMRLENFDEAGARAAWQASLDLRPSIWAWRNLAILAQRLGEQAEALECFSRAWELAADKPVLALAQEYLQGLCRVGEFAQAQQVYETLPAAFRQNDRLKILHARLALELGQLDEVEQALNHEFAVVREGETELTDIWFEMWYRRFSPDGAELDETARADIRQLYPPPARIDFRSIA